jgi:uncharacterized protein (DUF2062 family)
VVEPVVKQLTQGITPEKIALTLAVGSACALFPLLGTTTLLCLVVGIALRLNQPIIQIVNGVCTPLHFPVILGLIRFGNYIFGHPHTRINIRYMNQLFWDEPAVFFERFGVIAMHAAVAWLIIAPLWSIAIYAIARPVLRELVAMRVASVVKMSDEEPPVHPVP